MVKVIQRKVNFLARKLYYAHFIPSFFDYKITFVNSQLQNTNSKGDFVVKPRFETFVLKITGIQNKI